MKQYLSISLIILVTGVFFIGCMARKSELTIEVYPDSVLNDVSNHPVGINVNYFMDDDKYLKPKRPTAEALKAMGVKFLRYPGGNKSDFYLFSVPPYEKSKPTLAKTGKEAVGEYARVIKNYSEYRYDVLDFDEFIQMCREVGAEPVIVVAADEYLIKYPKGNTSSSKEQLLKNAVEWVRYANIKKKYGVKYWMIGNECWHNNNENSTPAIYARDVVDFSLAMKKIDPGILIIPNGNSDEFWKEVLNTAAGHIDRICLSNYPVYDYKAGYATYRDTLQDLMGPVKTALSAIAKYATEEDRKKLRIIVAEYGPFDWAGKWPFINDMGHNLANFEIAGEQLLIPRIEFSCFWNTRWIENDSIKYSVTDALDRDGNFNANGYGLMIWGKFLGEKMVKTTSTLHIRTFASLVRAEKKLTLFILNKSTDLKKIKPHIKGYAIKSIKQAWMLEGKGPDDLNPVWKKSQGIKENSICTIPGTSILVVEYILN